MKTYFSITTLFILLFTLGNTGNLSAQCSVDCPPTPPLIIHDGGKPDKLNPVWPDWYNSCFSPDLGEVGISFKYEYRTTQFPSLPARIFFTFTIVDLVGKGYPVEVISPLPIAFNAFMIQLDPSSLGPSPSGPYNAWIKNGLITFDLDFNIAVPNNYPSNNQVKVDVFVLEEYPKLTMNSLDTSFDIDICTDLLKTGNKTPINLNRKIVSAQPNPFNGQVEIFVQSQEELRPQISILNMQGQEIELESRLKYLGNESWKSNLATEELATGIYLYRIQIGDQIYTDKIVKQ